MGRRSGGGRSGGRAAPRRAASSTARRPAARPPARSAAASKPPARSAATKAAPPAKAAPAAAAPAQTGSAMGGFMANVASTGLGVAAGRAIDRTLFGGGGGGGGQEAMGEEVPLEGSSEYFDDSNNMPEMTDEMCSREVSEFKKCLARTGTDMQACKWNLDILMACQQQQTSTGFADAGRF